MAIYPAAKFRNIPPGVNDPAIIAMGAVLHVDAANSGSLYSYFNGPSGGIESHFFVRKDGVVEQYRDTKYEADANLHANSFIKNGKRYGYISIETQGFAKGEWNDVQVAEIKKLLLWLSHTHNFPLKKCATPTDPGVGYHVMFGSPGPWTPVAKDCPGPDRVKQYNNILVPWFKTATIPPVKPVPSTKDIIDMATQAEVAQAVSDGIRAYMKDFFTDEQGTGDSLADAAAERGQAQVAKLDELIAAVKDLTAAVNAKA